MARRRVLHRTGLVTLLVGGAMVLSGCWGVVVGPDQFGRKAVVMTPAATGQLVYVHCRGKVSDDLAKCVLAAVNDLCSYYPLRNMSGNDCLELTAYPFFTPGLVPDMQGAINQLLHGDVCLVGYFGPYINWTASPRGFACN